MFIIGFIPVFQNCGEGAESVDYDCLADIDINSFPFEGYNSAEYISYDSGRIDIVGMTELLLEKDETFLLKLLVKCDSLSNPSICDIDGDLGEIEVRIMGTWSYEQNIEPFPVLMSGNYGWMGSCQDCEFVKSNKLKGTCYLNVTDSSIPLKDNILKGEIRIECNLKTRTQSLSFHFLIYSDDMLHFSFLHEESYDLLNSD